MSINNSNSSLLGFSILWFIVSIFVCSITRQYSAEYCHDIITILVVFSYGLCLYYWIKGGNRVLSLYTLFVVYAFFSNAGQSLLHLFRFPEEMLVVYDDGTMSQLVDMLRFQYLCIAAMGIGTCLYLNSSKYKPITLENQRELLSKQSFIKKPRDSFYWAILLFCLVYVSYFAITMVALRQYMDYGDLYAVRGEWNNVFNQIVNLLAVMLSYYFLFRNKRTLIVQIFSVLIILLYMISGSRGMAIPYIGLLIVTLPITNPKMFKRRYWAFWLIGGIVFFSLLNVISTTRSSYLTSQSLNTTNTIAMNAYGTISEMGFSARTVTLTMNAIGNGSIEHHQTILHTLVTSLIPFTNDISFFQDQYIHLSSWISEYAGSFYSGLGYSFIAEAYMDFGWFGCIFVLLYGWFIAFAESLAYRRITRGHYYLALVLLVILSKQVFYARAELELIGGTLRLLEFISIIYFFFFYSRSSHNGA